MRIILSINQKTLEISTKSGQQKHADSIENDNEGSSSDGHSGGKSVGGN